MFTWKSWVGAAVVLATMTASAADPQLADQPVDTSKAMLDRMDRNVDGSSVWVKNGCRAEFAVY